MTTELPVVIEVAREDGTQEAIRVGTAWRSGGVFVLDLNALKIDSGEAAASASLPMPSSPTPVPRVGGTVGDLEYIAARARRTLADPSKARWHDKERNLLKQVEVELERFKAREEPGPGA